MWLRAALPSLLWTHRPFTTLGVQAFGTLSHHRLREIEKLPSNEKEGAVSFLSGFLFKTSPYSVPSADILVHVGLWTGALEMEDHANLA